MKTKSLIAKRLAVLAIAVGFLVTFVPQASAGQPCCNITKIDTRTGVVTAQDTTTGHTFQFTASPAVLQKMKVGQGVYANFKTNQVSINNVQPCCAIIPPEGKPAKAGVASPNNIIPPSEITPPNGTAATRGVPSPNSVIPPEGGPATRGVPNPNNLQPCCSITRIDARNGVVTATDKTTGHSFQFTASPSVQQSLKVGQPVYANFKSKQVSLNNVSPCCQIR